MLRRPEAAPNFTPGTEKPKGDDLSFECETCQDRGCPQCGFKEKVTDDPPYESE